MPPAPTGVRGICHPQHPSASQGSPSASNPRESPRHAESLSTLATYNLHSPEQNENTGPLVPKLVSVKVEAAEHCTRSGALLSPAPCVTMQPAHPQDSPEPGVEQSPG